MINYLKSKKKICMFILIFLIILSIAIPTLSKFKIRNGELETVWTGLVATSFHSGSGLFNDPYIISNGAELAYLSEQLTNNDYADVYFELSNNIILNDGILNYNDNNIEYILNDNTYYIKPYTNEYYDNNLYAGQSIGSINSISPLDGFKGHLNGKTYTISGIYVTNSSSLNLGLFTNLYGELSNLYIENSLIYGGNISGGIASNTSSAIVRNVIFNGNVIGNKTVTTKDETVSIDDKTIQYSGDGLSDNIYVLLPNVMGNINSTKFKGDISLDNQEANTIVTINGVRIDSSFEIDLDKQLLNHLEISITGDSNKIVLSNLSYDINYDENVVGGIFGYAENSSFSLVVNKGNVYGNVAGGIIGTSINTNVDNSYNLANINAQKMAAGLIAIVRQNISNTFLLSSYSNNEIVAPMKGALIGSISDGENTTIDKSFSTINSAMIDNVKNANVVITNSYKISSIDVNNGILVGSFNNITNAELVNKQYMITHLAYNEFVSVDDLIINTSNRWVYEDEALPILYIDDIPIAAIYASTYSWDSFSSNINNLNFSSNITFDIKSMDNYRNVKEIYYYIDNFKQPMNKTNLDSLNEWILYEDITQITEEGFYTIYAKVIDYNNKTTYLNSDLLVIDKTGSTINIKLNQYTWSTRKDDLNNIYLDQSGNVSIEAIDLLSGINTLEYYISNTKLNQTQIEELSNWEEYSSNLTIDDNTKEVIYVKATDNSGSITYANTDFISVEGYNITNYYLGRRTNSDTLNISSNSTISFDIEYNNSVGFISGDTHNLISNTLLPKGTKITLYDKNNYRSYVLNIDTEDDIYGFNDSCNGDICYATYPLSSFVELGKKNMINNFQETDYFVSNNVNEKFKVFIDFEKTNIITNYSNIILSMSVFNGNNIRIKTLNNSLKSFSLSNNYTNQIVLNTNYDLSNIYLNSISNTSVNINSNIIFNNIIDTSYEDQKIGLAIKVVDSNNNLVSKNYYDNMYFSIEDMEYGASNDNITYIPLGQGFDNISKDLSILTTTDNIKLENGTYYLILNTYISNDGFTVGNKLSNDIRIPLIVADSNYVIKHDFDVIMDSKFKILDKTKQSLNMDFNIIKKGSLTSSSIIISLYEKDELTAYDQTYSLIDINRYLNIPLNEYENKKYLALNDLIDYKGTIDTYNNFSLNMNPSLLNYKAYKLVFDLYDGNKKIDTIEKNFVVR